MKYISSKFKSFALCKTVKRMKGQAAYWEEIFAKRISDKGLLSTIYK